VNFFSRDKDVFFANEKSANVHQITSDNKRLRIDSAGFIYLEMRLSATLSCHMRFEHFPMDVQVMIALMTALSIAQSNSQSITSF